MHQQRPPARINSRNRELWVIQPHRDEIRLLKCYLMPRNRRRLPAPRNQVVSSRSQNPEFRSDPTPTIQRPIQYQAWSPPHHLLRRLNPSRHPPAQAQPTTRSRTIKIPRSMQGMCFRSSQPAILHCTRQTLGTQANLATPVRSDWQATFVFVSRAVFIELPSKWAAASCNFVLVCDLRGTGEVSRPRYC